MTTPRTDEDTVSFYTEISERYDWIFSEWDEVTRRHADELAPLLAQHEVGTVLDCACGTGLQAVGLALRGYAVTGCDLTPAMLARAQGRADRLGLSIPLVQCDFRGLGSKIPDAFDAVICMGNSLPHLMTDGDILAALRSMRARVRPGGLLVIGTRDYDRLLAERTRFIPLRVNTRVSEGLVTILFVLDYLDNRIRFNLVYIIEGDDGAIRLQADAVDYNSLRCEQLLGLLRQSGFRDVSCERAGAFCRYTGIRAAAT